MRRRQIEKERTDGIIKDQQERAGLGVSQSAGERRERKTEIQHGLAEHGGGDAHERVRKPAKRVARKRQKQKLRG